MTLNSLSTSPPTERKNGCLGPRVCDSRARALGPVNNPNPRSVINATEEDVSTEQSKAVQARSASGEFPKPNPSNARRHPTVTCGVHVRFMASEPRTVLYRFLGLSPSDSR